MIRLNYLINQFNYIELNRIKFRIKWRNQGRRERGLKCVLMWALMKIEIVVMWEWCKDEKMKCMIQCPGHSQVINLEIQDLRDMRVFKAGIG